MLKAIYSNKMNVIAYENSNSSMQHAEDFWRSNQIFNSINSLNPKNPVNSINSSSTPKIEWNIYNIPVIWQKFLEISKKH
jgi:hypothetical protein